MKNSPASANNSREKLHKIIWNGFEENKGSETNLYEKNRSGVILKAIPESYRESVLYKGGRKPKPMKQQAGALNFNDYLQLRE